MKFTFLTILICTQLFACSKADSGDLTLSCYGKLVTSIGDNQPTVSKITQNYKFHNLKFNDYECTEHDFVIGCTSASDVNGTREHKRIIYDTKSLVFTETNSVWGLSKNQTPMRNLIRKSEFIGVCQKPLFKFAHDSGGDF